MPHPDLLIRVRSNPRQYCALPCHTVTTAIIYSLVLKIYLHADNIVFALPGLIELTVQVWMRKLKDPDLIVVIRGPKGLPA